MDLEVAINEVLSYESTRKSWEKVWNSKEMIAATKLGKAINHDMKSSCSDCLNDLFILIKLYKRDKNKLNQKQEVMNSNYELHPSKVLSFPKLGIHITNANLTDEIAKEYLAIYPAAIVHFKKVPENHGFKKVIVKTVEEAKKEVVEVKIKGIETLRQIADGIADKKGIKRPHWKANDFTLENFIKDYS